MNEKRVKELQDTYIAFMSILELEQMIMGKNTEEEAIEAASRELEKRESMGLSESDTGTDKKEKPPYVMFDSIDFVVGLILSILIFLYNIPLDGPVVTIFFIMMLIGNYIGISIVRKLSKTEKPVVRVIQGLIGGIVATFVIGIFGGFIMVSIISGGTW